MPTFKERLRYKFERFLAKGGVSVFLSLVVVFILSLIALIILRWLILLVFPGADYFDNFFHDIWVTFLEMTDPGNMNQDNEVSRWLKITTILSGLVGVIIFSMLIAFITTALENTLYEFRKGRGPVLESEQTLILGWNDRVIDIILELIIANESERNASVVVLANHDKEEMDDLIVKRITDAKTTKIITSSGDPASISELKRVSADKAKSVIILANCSDSATQEDKVLSDTQSVKTIMALISCQDGENELPIIAEIFNEEKRELVRYFEDDNIISIDSWDIMGKLLVQTSLTSGLEMVYNEILSFDGSEIYFYDAEWNGTDFYDLSYHFRDGIPLGLIRADGTLMLRPPAGTKMEEGDEILILANDDSTINFDNVAHVNPQHITPAATQLEQKQKRVLILGWHSVGSIFVNEAGDYLKEGSVFDIMFDDPSTEIKSIVQELKTEFTQFEINLHNNDPLDLKGLEAMKPFEYDNVIILSQDAEEQSPEKIDSDTLMILLLLRKIAVDNQIKDHHTKIITQVLNSENQDLIVQTDVDDFIISNKLITMILAQLSEEPKIKMLYDDLFQEEGSEIYVKPASLYFDSLPLKAAFGDIIALAQQREEICLGLRLGKDSANPKANFGVSLNLPKDQQFTISEDDFLVVLAEDEL